MLLRAKPGGISINARPILKYTVCSSGIFLLLFNVKIYQ
jgi:hypothetical protein